MKFTSCPDCPETQASLEQCEVCHEGLVCPKHGCLNARCPALPKERAIAGQYGSMSNKRMAEKLTAREALDVRSLGREIEPGVFALGDFVDEVDYCDALKEEWIGSIGRERATNELFAAVDARFCQDPLYECLWLR